MSESLETSEGDASSKETHFVNVLGTTRDGFGAVVAVVGVVSVEELECVDTDPPAPSLTSYDSVWTHPCLPQPSVQVSSDALYTPDLAPSSPSSPSVPALLIPLVGGTNLFYFSILFIHISAVP